MAQMCIFMVKLGRIGEILMLGSWIAEGMNGMRGMRARKGSVGSPSPIKFASCTVGGRSAASALGQYTDFAATLLSLGAIC